MGSEGLNVEREGASRRDRKASQGVECRCESGGDGTCCPPCDGRVGHWRLGVVGKAVLCARGALRGSVCRLVPDGSEQFVAGGIDCAGGVEVALGIGDGIELLEGEAGFEERRGIGKGFELLAPQFHDCA